MTKPAHDIRRTKGQRRRAIKGNPLDWAIETRDQATLDMVNDAIRHKEVMLAYQPIVHAKDPAKPAFFEGLIRVLDETGRVIPARDFIAHVEDTHAGRQLDCLALEMGLKTLTDNPRLSLSINMSARSIGYGDWNHLLTATALKQPDVARRLILEISEPSAMQVPELVMDFMDDFQARGVGFALDDYASKLTSFRYFKDFFFDYIKLDGYFTQNISNVPENQYIAEAVARLARQFECFTVASRVATMEDASTLARLGFNCLQGYFFGAPTVNPPWKSAVKEKSTQEA